ncbi:Histidine triad nucleotide-binding protein [Apis cerana cerana]|uniref:Adenosine 5'-monophosphoramidase HINT3 n=1 Tax=Apis cerana cerana TaxID=94128 RepID=A0A2A3ERD8_APICC|nr:Histidine triad nucleotide-binding protein [Apis cerana cerana]
MIKCMYNLITLGETQKILFLILIKEIDNYVTCIKDIHPVSTHHYLILPKEHIRNAKQLKPEHIELYNKMLAAIDIISQKQGLDRAVTRTGFHWPPFNTVSHLHLHVISPISNIKFYKRYMYEPGSCWFTDYVKSRLQDNKLII